jgi:hypothetical protein
MENGQNALGEGTEDMEIAQDALELEAPIIDLDLERGIVEATADKNGKFKHRCTFCEYNNISAAVVSAHEISHHGSLRKIRTCTICDKVNS